MKKVLNYASVLLFISLMMSSLNGSSYIVLTEFDNQNSAIQNRYNYEEIVKKNEFFNRLLKDEKFTIYTEESSSVYLLKMGPFKKGDSVALAYLKAKEYFPQAFIIENNKLEPKVKIVYEEIEVAKDDLLSWIAIFSLAVIGILALFFSSKQIKQINNKHVKIQKQQEKLELFLTKMGENIFELTKKVIKGDNTNINQKELPSVNCIKNKLFDETRMMIYFLRLKSKKVQITHEEFNLNRMMSNILGTISSNFKNSQIELIFNIDKNVPKIIGGDLLHLSELLIELLQNAIRNTLEGQVELKISIINKNELKFGVSDTGVGLSDDKLGTLFVPTYTQDGEYKGVGLYVAHELSSMMGGELFVEKSDSSGTVINCVIPLINQKVHDKRKYRLPRKSYMYKSVLLYESNKSAAKAIKKMLNYFKYSVDIVSPHAILSKTVDLSSYDLIMGDIVHFDPIDVETIKTIRREKKLKIINLNSIFTAEKYFHQEYIDEWLEKPLTQERLCDLLVVLFDESGEESVSAQAKNRLEKLKVYYPDSIKKTDNIVNENFKDFKGAHALVVDDSFIDQKLFKNIFERGDMQVTLVNNGEQALEKLREKDAQFDIVVMDISMPIMDGYTAIDEIRRDHKFDTLPIVVSTSMTLDSEIKKMFHLGANAYLGKPLNLGYLYTVLTHFLQADEEVVSELEKANQNRLEHIEGLDFKKGIEHANNSEELYLEVLKEFLLAYGDSGATLKRMVKENRYQQAKRLCLDMKGLTGAIGAYEMFDIVDSMYKQYIYNNVHLIPKFVETYNDGLNKLLDAIEQYKSSR